MNKQQKAVQQQFLKNEAAALKRLKTVYSRASKDVNAKIKKLDLQIAGLNGMWDNFEGTADEKEQLKSIIQSKVYQKRYQEAIQGQVDDILKDLQNDSYNSISEYLEKSYEDGFIGTYYSLHGQGIPLIMPLNQEAVVKAVQLDSKISKGLYNHLGENVSTLKKHISNEVARGLANGSSYEKIAQQITFKMKGTYNNPGGALAYATRIARTEGHRIQVQGAMDACYEAKKKGVDVVKQWDSTLDDSTRDSHVAVDGEIRELDEAFSNGLMFPGDPAGGVKEVVNCRCALLERAKWALDTDELNTLKDRAAFFGVDKTDQFEEFKTKYLKAAETLTNSVNDVIISPKNSNDTMYNDLLFGLKKRNIEYNPVYNHTKQKTEDEIISAIAGGDMTGGSCASVGLSYIGQKQGWEVLDFRDGHSRRFFASTTNLHTLSQMNGMKVLKAQGASSMTVGNRLVQQCEAGKEYYLAVGKHAAIVRKTNEGKLQYLELQSSKRSGWTDFDGNPRYTLKTRFGCSNTSSSSATFDYMLDLEDSDFTSNDDFRSLLGYINTAENEQRKGTYGTIK